MARHQKQRIAELFEAFDNEAIWQNRAFGIYVIL